MFYMNTTIKNNMNMFCVGCKLMKLKQIVDAQERFADDTCHTNSLNEIEVENRFSTGRCMDSNKRKIDTNVEHSMHPYKYWKTAFIVVPKKKLPDWQQVSATNVLAS